MATLPSHPGLRPRRTRMTRRTFFGAAAGTAALTLLRGNDALAASAPAERSLREDFVGRLCYNENPLGPSPLAITAMSQSLSLGNRYPDWYGESLRQDLAALHGLPMGQILAGCGGTEMLNLCARALASPGKNVICPDPSYNQFSGDAQLLGAEVRYVALDDNYRVDLSRIASRVDSNTTAICITNPNNPTATVLAYDAIESFIDALPPFVTVVFDEAYHEYIHDPGYGSTMEFVRQSKNVVTIRTFSKVFGLAGVRIGYLATRANLVNEIARNQIWGTVSRPALVASRAALTDAGHITDTVALNDQAKAFCFAQFDAMGLAYIPSETNFFMVDVGESSAHVASELAQRDIEVRTGWGMPDHLRVSTGTLAEMTAFITALQEILGAGAVADLPARTTAMYGNFPNPVTGRTRIVYSTAGAMRVRVQVFDIQGRLVRTLIDAPHAGGYHEIEWDRRDDRGVPAQAGAYYYRMTAGERSETRRMIVL